MIDKIIPENDIKDSLVSLFTEDKEARGLLINIKKTITLCRANSI